MSNDVNIWSMNINKIIRLLLKKIIIYTFMANDIVHVRLCLLFSLNSKKGDNRNASDAVSHSA